MKHKSATLGHRVATVRTARRSSPKLLNFKYDFSIGHPSHPNSSKLLYFISIYTQKGGKWGKQHNIRKQGGRRWTVADGALKMAGDGKKRQ